MNRRIALVSLCLLLQPACGSADDFGRVCDEDETPTPEPEVQGDPPTEAEVLMDPPDFVFPQDPFSCIVSGFSTDPDGDPVAYRFEWLIDGVLAPEITSTQIQPPQHEAGQTWTCRVTPTDGTHDGPATEVSVEIEDPNTPPGAPFIEIQPSDPDDDDTLLCVIIKPSPDVEGDPIDYTFEWFRDDKFALSDVSEVDASETSPGEQWTCVVTPSDDFAEGEPGIDEVTIGE
jgi:hypothetical protein